MQTYPLAGHLDGIPVDHASQAGDVGQGEGREEREVKDEAEHGGECSRAGMTRMRRELTAECRLSLGSRPVYPQELP